MSERIIREEPRHSGRNRQEKTDHQHNLLQMGERSAGSHPRAPRGFRLGTPQ
jgi:hypothetical protein